MKKTLWTPFSSTFWLMRRCSAKTLAERRAVNARYHPWQRSAFALQLPARNLRLGVILIILLTLLLFLPAVFSVCRTKVKSSGTLWKIIRACDISSLGRKKKPNNYSSKNVKNRKIRCFPMMAHQVELCLQMTAEGSLLQTLTGLTNGHFGQPVTLRMSHNEQSIAILDSL